MSVCSSWGWWKFETKLTTSSCVHKFETHTHTSPWYVTHKHIHMHVTTHTHTSKHADHVVSCHADHCRVLPCWPCRVLPCWPQLSLVLLPLLRAWERGYVPPCWTLPCPTMLTNIHHYHGHTRTPCCKGVKTSVHWTCTLNFQLIEFPTPLNVHTWTETTLYHVNIIMHTLNFKHTHNAHAHCLLAWPCQYSQCCLTHQIVDPWVPCQCLAVFTPNHYCVPPCCGLQID